MCAIEPSTPPARRAGRPPSTATCCVATRRSRRIASSPWEPRRRDLHQGLEGVPGRDVRGRRCGDAPRPVHLRLRSLGPARDGRPRRCRRGLPRLLHRGVGMGIGSAQGLVPVTSVAIRAVFVVTCWATCILAGYLLWTGDPNLQPDGAIAFGILLALVWNWMMLSFGRPGVPA